MDFKGPRHGNIRPVRNACLCLAPNLAGTSHMHAALTPCQCMSHFRHTIHKKTHLHGMQHACCTIRTCSAVFHVICDTDITADMTRHTKAYWRCGYSAFLFPTVPVKQPALPTSPQGTPVETLPGQMPHVHAAIPMHLHTSPCYMQPYVACCTDPQPLIHMQS